MAVSNFARRGEAKQRQKRIAGDHEVSKHEKNSACWQEDGLGDRDIVLPLEWWRW